MNVKPGKLSDAVHLALAVGTAATIGLAGTAFAQSTSAPQAAQQKTQTLQTVEVTGSHIRAAALATSNPVTTITAEQIEATGALNIGTVIQQLPAITGGLHTANLDFGGGSGATYVGLRGLGSSRTLVLIDGQRIQAMTRGTETSGVDLGSIPAAAVERIEVLKDGASAIYGTDAIGGVINIILKSNYQGAQFSANYGISDHGDGARRGGSFVFGQSSDKGSLVAGVSYNKFDPVLGQDRKFTGAPLSLTTTAGGRRLGVPGPQGLIGKNPLVSITVSPALAARFGCSSGQTLTLTQAAWEAGASPTTPSDYRCFTGADNLNYFQFDNLVSPQERTNAFINGKFRLSDNVSVFVTDINNVTNSRVNVFPPSFQTPFVPGVAVSKDSYYNPFGVDFSEATGNTFANYIPDSGIFVDGARSTFNYLLTGLQGDATILNQDWTWDLGMDYSHIGVESYSSGLWNNPQLAAGAGPSFLNADGVVQCGSASAPISLSQCTPWDPFNSNTPSAKAAFSNPVAEVSTSLWIQRIYHADATGGLIDLPAGTAQVAVGVSYRREYQNGTTSPSILLNPANDTCVIGSSCSGPALNGAFNVKEAYGELFVPIVKDVPFMHELDMTLGERYSKYSDFGSTSNWKVALSYRPIEDLLLRGTISTVFRAPTLPDIFAPATLAQETIFSDPCDFVAPTPTTPNPNAGSPACAGVPAQGSFTNTAAADRIGVQAKLVGAAAANFPIQPETGKSFDFGAVYSPGYAPGLSLSADVWRIYLNDLLTLISGQTELNLCAAGSTQFCPLIKRFPTGASQGQIQQIISPSVNLGRLDVKGLDFSAQYRLPFDRFGQFTAGLVATYQTQFKSQTEPGSAGNVVSNGAGLMGVPGSAFGAACPAAFGGTCYMPRIRARGTLSWRLGPWSATWTMRDLGRFSIAGDTGTQQGVDRYGATVYNDLVAGYDIQPLNTRITVGVDDAFDREPPMLFANRSNEFNTDTQDFDVLGRYYWARATVSF